MASYDLIGIGNTTQDYLGVVDRLPSKPDEGAALLSFTVQGGGVVATAMVAAARLGLNVAHIDAIGDDDVGKQVLADLEAEGVSTEFMQVVPGATTPCCIVLVHKPTGKRSLLCNPGNARQHLTKLPRAAKKAIRDAWGMHVFQPRDPLIREAVELASKAGTKVSFDSADASDEAFETFRMGDVLIAPEEYLKTVNVPPGVEIPHEDYATMDAVVGGAKNAIITMGERGCIGTEDGNSTWRVPALGVDVVDTTGAGDTFHGAYMAAWWRGYDFFHRMIYASGAAAMKCTKLGGRAGIPTHDELMAFFAERDVKFPGVGEC